MEDDRSDDEYRVGYARPPKHSRFKPGTSGNPRGKRKGARSFATEVQRLLQAPVKLKHNGKPRQVTSQEAILLRLLEKALKGETRSLELVMGAGQRFNNEPPGLAGPKSLSEDDEILAAYERELLVRAIRPLTGPGRGEEES